MRNLNTVGETNVAEAAISHRQLHNAVNHTENYNSTVVYLHESPKSPLSDNSGSQNAGERTGSLLLYIIMVLILAPCLAAAVAQALYTWKKRVRDRRERQLAEVSTNPGGRRLILDEILKGNSRAVTGDEVSPRKKRVLVKKRRKKTPVERLREKENKSGVDEEIDQSDAKSMSYVADLKMKDYGHPINNNNAEPWWDVEEVLSDGRKVSKSKDDLDLDMEGRGRIVICLSKDLEVDEGDSAEPNSSAMMDELTGTKRTLFLSRDHSSDICSTLDGNISKQGEKVCGDYDWSITSHEDDASCTNEMRSMPPPLPQIISFDAEEERASADTNENVGDEVVCEVDNTLVGSNSTEHPSEEHDKNKLEPDPDETAEVVRECEKRTFLITNDCLPSTQPGDHAKKVDFSMSASLMPELKHTDDSSSAVKLKPKIQLHISDDDVMQRTKSPQQQEELNTTSSETTVSSHSLFSMSKVSNIDENSNSSESALPFRAFSSNSEASEELSSVVHSSYGLILPALSEEHDDWETESNGPDHDNSCARNIFRGSSKDELKGNGGIQAKGSSLTDEPSNVAAGDSYLNSGRDTSFSTPAFPPDVIESSNAAAADKLPSYRLEQSLSMSSGLSKPIALKPVESYVTDASSVSYFSYEDVSIDENELEMCAICLCAYEEGDIRIFSKRCTHSFHKECVFEWLVKGHEECPCCRANMVTKSEIKETSASLIGTERLAQAMAAVNGSEMIEAPPFQARRSRLASQFLARARARQPSRGVRANGPDAQRQRALGFQRFNEGTPVSPMRSTAPSSNNIHNRDWIWTARFGGQGGQTSTPPTSPVNQPTDSAPSDSAQNVHQSPRGAISTDDGRSDVQAIVQDTSMYHSHWTQRTRRNSLTSSPRRTTQQSGPIALSPSVSNRHSHWQRTTAQLEQRANLASPSSIHPARSTGVESTTESPSSVGRTFNTASSDSTQPNTPRVFDRNGVVISPVIVYETSTVTSPGALQPCSHNSDVISPSRVPSSDGLE